MRIQGKAKFLYLYFIFLLNVQEIEKCAESGDKNEKINLLKKSKHINLICKIICRKA